MKAGAFPRRHCPRNPPPWPVVWEDIYPPSRFYGMHLLGDASHHLLGGGGAVEQGRSEGRKIICIEIGMVDHEPDDLDDAHIPGHLFLCHDLEEVFCLEFLMMLVCEGFEKCCHPRLNPVGHRPDRLFPFVRFYHLKFLPAAAV